MTVLTEVVVTGPLTADARAVLASSIAQAGGAVRLRISSTGFPVEEVGNAGAVSQMSDLCGIVAGCPASVAVLTGRTEGAALELALAAGLRVAEAGALLRFTDLSFGLVPASGGTQRLPRLVGGADALRLLVGGADVTAAEALAIGLVDHVTEDDPLALAHTLSPDPLPRKGLRDGRGYLAALAVARQGDISGAAARMVDCVEMALMLPLEQGLAYERVCFDDLAAGEVSKGLRHAAAVFAQAAGGEGASVARVGIWGAGPAAVDLALGALRAGLVVQLAAAEREAVVRALADVAERQEASVQAGTLETAGRDDEWARLLPQVGTSGLAGVDLSLLTEPVDLDGPRIAIGIAPEGGAIGLSRFDGLAELHAAGASAPDVAAAAGFARAMGWQPVISGSGGSVALRLASALSDAVLWAEGRGITRADIARSISAQGIAGEGVSQGGEPDEVALRCLAALANAGARAIEAGEAPSAAHVDAVAIAAGLMARWTGGPMHQANRRGLLVLRRDLRLWQADDVALWLPAPLINRLVAEGRGF